MHVISVRGQVFRAERHTREKPECFCVIQEKKGTKMAKIRQGCKTKRMYVMVLVMMTLSMKFARVRKETDAI